MPSIQAHLTEPTPTPPRSVHENHARRSYVLARYDEDLSTLHVLLPFAGAEPHACRDRLAALGFEPLCSPARAAVSWSRHVAASELRPLLLALREAFGDAVVLDLGGVFADGANLGDRRKAVSAYWPGLFLIHVGGTRRTVTFATTVGEADLDQMISEAREDYFAHEFHGPTE